MILSADYFFFPREGSSRRDKLWRIGKTGRTCEGLGTSSQSSQRRGGGKRKESTTRETKGTPWTKSEDAKGSLIISSKFVFFLHMREKRRGT